MKKGLQLKENVGNTKYFSKFVKTFSNPYLFRPFCNIYHRNHLRNYIFDLRWPSIKTHFLMALCNEFVNHKLQMASWKNKRICVLHLTTFMYLLKKSIVSLIVLYTFKIANDKL